MEMWKEKSVRVPLKGITEHEASWVEQICVWSEHKIPWNFVTSYDIVIQLWEWLIITSI